VTTARWLPSTAVRAAWSAERRACGRAQCETLPPPCRARDGPPLPSDDVHRAAKFLDDNDRGSAEQAGHGTGHHARSSADGGDVVTARARTGTAARGPEHVIAAAKCHTSACTLG